MLLTLFVFLLRGYQGRERLVRPLNTDLDDRGKRSTARRTTQRTGVRVSRARFRGITQCSVENDAIFQDYGSTFILSFSLFSRFVSAEVEVANDSIVILKSLCAFKELSECLSHSRVYHGNDDSNSSDLVHFLIIPL